MFLSKRGNLGRFSIETMYVVGMEVHPVILFHALLAEEVKQIQSRIQS